MTAPENYVSRRDLLRVGAAASAGAVLLPSGSVFAAGSDKMRVAMVGCGSRGTKDAIDCLKSDSGAELVAMADLFQDRLDGSLAHLRKQCPDKVKVTPETRFLGFDAYQKVMAMDDVDIVLLLTPPGFRPQMVRAAVEAGKHIFMEKPGAVDPVGIRSLMASADIADRKKLSIVVGTQQRWQPQYQELMKRVHNGDLGDIVGGQAYWNWGSSKWHFQQRQPGWSDMEWQIRCWPYFTWLSGDHIVEQHLHNMDVINWAIGSPPVSCMGMGGRQARTDPAFGNIYDHFTIEYQYPNGIRVMSMSSQIEGSTPKVQERVLCAKGATVTDRSMGYIEDTHGRKVFTYDDPIHSGEVTQFKNLIGSIRNGRPINECRRIAESTMTVIMGRMSAYTGRALKWDWAMKASKLDLSPEKLEMGDMPVRPVAIPGRDHLV
ncbi:MAG: Gfo/Idh/MocA family oxidoreductase [Sedimentisphaerales bacterium]|nr:Gfo/Idh/MocA family oxidoreductase [Sedimentisphaerales bacterium]